MFELMLTLDLRDEFSEEELAGRWHLGAGPKPETLRIVTEFPLVVEDEHGEPVIENHPEPLLASHGEAFKMEGALVSVLERRADTGGGAWALTSRQEVHPDGFELVGELLGWLATRPRLGRGWQSACPSAIASLCCSTCSWRFFEERGVSVILR
ncbi:hypothetical protein ACFV2N_37760 [Streptomyces sp. NPDC059680]|uniref:hypothetical protein n=1 Tax=Streptomyces sp. NPDC059680 TaxID=3346904 RepID=UPI00369ABEF4